MPFTAMYSSAESGRPVKAVSEGTAGVTMRRLSTNDDDAIGRGAMERAHNQVAEGMWMRLRVTTQITW